MKSTRILAWLAAAWLCGAAARAEQITLTVVDDTCFVQDGGADDNNFGGRMELLTSNSSATGSNRRFGLLRFDVSSLAGQVGTVNAMTLKVRLRNGGTRTVPTTGQILDLYRVARANGGWIEGTGLAGDSVANNVPTPDTSTYRAKSDNVTAGLRVPWAGSAGLNTVGTDYFAGALGSTQAFTAASGYAVGTVIEIPLISSAFPLADMVNEWIADGASNAGLLIRGRIGTANGQIFLDSLETPDSGAMAAQLVIDYSPPGVTPYAAWLEANTVLGADADPNSDPDGDGEPNVLEFALNTNPHSGVMGTRRRQQIAGDALQCTIPVRSTAVFFQSFGLVAEVDGVRYTIEGSFDLLDWNAGIEEVSPAAATNLPALDAGWSYRTFRLAVPVSSSSQGYLRVTATFL